LVTPSAGQADDHAAAAFEFKEEFRRFKIGSVSASIGIDRSICASCRNNLQFA
jgi:hypothetical protein